MTLVKSRFRPHAFPVLFDDAFFKEFFDVNNSGSQNFSKNVPAVNVRETDVAYQLEVAAPGLKKEDFKISVEHNVLTISSEVKKEESSQEDGKYSRKEFSYSAFSRSFNLDDQHTDVENISANYENGVLHLNIPKKSESEKVKKTIAIQ